LNPASLRKGSKMSCRCLLAFAVALSLTSIASAADIQGELTGYLPAGLYTVVDDISVPSGGSLTLAAGVIFEFEAGFLDDYEFEVYGRLTAVGTVSQPIIFRPASGVEEFNYIRLSGAGTHMAHCIVDGAGSVALLDEGGLWIDDCSPVIENCEIRDGTWHGIYITGSSAKPLLQNCFIHDNARDGVDCYDGAGVEILLCTVTDNGTDGICLSDGSNTIVNCLIAGNGEDGIDCHGITDYDATVVNCTVGEHPGAGLSDSGNFEMFNCVVVGEYEDVGSSTHTYVIDDADFLGFMNPSALNFRLSVDSPCRNSGYRFGAVAGLLPQYDLDGNPRINDIVDIGAYESTAPPFSGEEGDWFSRALISPRLTRGIIREDGESFTVQVAILGTYSAGDASVRLISPMEEVFHMSVTSVGHRDRTPGSDLHATLYGPGIERVQEIQVTIPIGTPEDFYDIEVDLGSYAYRSVNAVKVLDQYPDDWGFIHISDSHIVYDNGDYTTTERFRRFAREVNFLRPEFVVHTGDACDFEHLGTTFNDSLLSVMALLDVPQMVVAGNHDHYNWDWIAHNPCGYLYFFQRVNRVMSTELRFDDARLYCLNSGADEGLLELARCWGPTVEVLDWMESLLSSATEGAGPLFLLTHGPTFDFYMWSLHNKDRIVQMLDSYGFSLALAGHTHRVDTYLNEGDNYYGRNDFFHWDDWERDIPFPGFPLHVQISSLGKGDGLGWSDYPWPSPLLRMSGEMAPLPNEGPAARGIDSDSIAWRWIQVDEGEVDFFTSDDDGDGYRNTELAWILGKLQFRIDSLPEGAFLSTVDNSHFENWSSVVHSIPADPALTYDVFGGTFIRQLPDGTVEVAVDELASRDSSVVLITPGVTSCAEGIALPQSTGLTSCSPSPFRESVEILFEVCPGEGEISIEVIDLSGRVVATPFSGSMTEPRATVLWDGSDPAGSRLPAGVYFCLLRAGDTVDSARLVLLP